MVGLLGYDRCGFGRRIGPGVACGPRARSHLYASGGVASRSATGAAVGVNSRRVQLEATRIGDEALRAAGAVILGVGALVHVLVHVLVGVAGAGVVAVAGGADELLAQRRA